MHKVIKFSFILSFSQGDNIMFLESPNHYARELPTFRIHPILN